MIWEHLIRTLRVDALVQDEKGFSADLGSGKAMVFLIKLWILPDYYDNKIGNDSLCDSTNSIRCINLVPM